MTNDHQRVTVKAEMAPRCSCDSVPLVEDTEHGEHLICIVCGVEWYLTWVEQIGVTNQFLG